MSLSIAQKSIIKASIPFLEANGVELTSKFYAYMLETNPSVRPFFNKSHQITKAQPKILAFALVNYAKNIDDLTPLLGFVEQIVEKHAGLQVTPDQYDIVGSCLLKTLKEMVGEGATDEFMTAWKDAYYYLANILISLEKSRYAEELKIDHAWLGFKDAKIESIKDEAENIKSLLIKPVDGKVAEFHPGQYITIRFTVDGAVQSREYSISNELNNPEYYRISVRRIKGGVVSNFVHDKLAEGTDVQITAPYGKLLKPYLKAVNENDLELVKKPVVFFIGGIGITPSISLLRYFLQRGNQVELNYSNDSLKTRGFGQWISSLAEEYPEKLTVNEYITNLDTASETAQSDKKHNHHILHKRFDPASDIPHLNAANVNNYSYYLVGPIGYMNAVTSHLSSLEFDVNKINSEQYAPIAV